MDSLNQTPGRVTLQPDTAQPHTNRWSLIDLNMNWTKDTLNLSKRISQKPAAQTVAKVLLLVPALIALIAEIFVKTPCILLINAARWVGNQIYCLRSQPSTPNSSPEPSSPKSNSSEPPSSSPSNEMNVLAAFTSPSVPIRFEPSSGPFILPSSAKQDKEPLAEPQLEEATSRPSKNYPTSPTPKSAKSSQDTPTAPTSEPPPSVFSMQRVESVFSSRLGSEKPNSGTTDGKKFNPFH